MAHAQAEVEPKQWTYTEAYNSGKGGFHIKVGLDGNPFKGPLSEAWRKGWQDAFSAEPVVKKRYDYPPEDREERRPRPRVGGSKSSHREQRW